MPRPAAPGTPKATAKSTPATPDLLGGDFAAAPPRPASANDAMGAFMGSSSTPANPDVFGAAAPAQQAQAPQPSQPDLFANAPANAVSDTSFFSFCDGLGIYVQYAFLEHAA